MQRSAETLIRPAETWRDLEKRGNRAYNELLNLEQPCRYPRRPGAGLQISAETLSRSADTLGDLEQACRYLQRPGARAEAGVQRSVDTWPAVTWRDLQKGLQRDLKNRPGVGLRTCRVGLLRPTKTWSRPAETWNRSTEACRNQEQVNRDLQNPRP